MCTISLGFRENNILPSVAILSRDFYFLSLLNMCATVHLWMSEDSLVGSVLSFLLYMGSKDQSLVIRLTRCFSFQTISSAGKVSFFQCQYGDPQKSLKDGTLTMLTVSIRAEQDQRLYVT